MALAASLSNLKRSVVVASLLIAGCSSSATVVTAESDEQVASTTASTTAADPTTASSAPTGTTTAPASTESVQSDYPWDAAISQATLTLTAISEAQSEVSEEGSSDIEPTDPQDTDCPLGDVVVESETERWFAEDGGTIVCFSGLDPLAETGYFLLGITVVPSPVSGLIADEFNEGEPVTESAAGQFGPGEVVSACVADACGASWMVPGLQVLIISSANTDQAATEDLLRSYVQAALEGAGSFDLSRIG